MTNVDPAIRGVADTARWVAIYRAIESERPDALFRDPFARRLAGERGDRISREMPASARKAGWAFVARTVLFDQFILEQIAGGVDLVVNLAAGLDTRPYRMQLPGTLKWVEVDQAELLEEKTAQLADTRPVCAVERIALDLAREEPRLELFSRLGQSAKKALIVTEGLLVYLSPEQVGRLAQDLAAQPSFQAWLTDLASPRLLKMIANDWGKKLEAGSSPLKFAPETGPAFFNPYGWSAAEIRPTFTTAAKIKRLPLFLRLMTALPGAGTFHPRRPWSATCLLRPTA